MERNKFQKRSLLDRVLEKPEMSQSKTVRQPFLLLPHINFVDSGIKKRLKKKRKRTYLQKSDSCWENVLWTETKNIKLYHKDHVTSVRHGGGSKRSLNQAGWPIITINMKSRMSVKTITDMCTDVDEDHNKS